MALPDAASPDFSCSHFTDLAEKLQQAAQALLAFAAKEQPELAQRNTAAAASKAAGPLGSAAPIALLPRAVVYAEI